jgi:soluble lytic murein transglycosylase-like protein
LIINDKRDDRLDTQLSTKAALAYLQQTHEQFGNWKLAFVAYEIGEKNTDSLIKEIKSRDAWALARSPSAPKSLKKSIAMFDAALIIMHNPSLIDNHT